MKRVLLSLVAAWALLAPMAASACPLCKDAIPQSDDTRTEFDPERQALGYNYSIYFMLAVPFTLASVMGIVIYRACRNAPANQLPPDQIA